MRSNRTQQVVIGTASPTNAGVRAAPPPHRDFFIFRLAKATTEDELKTYLGHKNVTVHEVMLLSHPQSKFKSFKVNIPVGDVNKIMDPTTWPQGVARAVVQAARSTSVSC